MHGPSPAVPVISTALTASALYALLRRADFCLDCRGLPQKFAGRTCPWGRAGVGRVEIPGRNGGVADLVGVISLDGVPLQNQARRAGRTRRLRGKDTGRYVPARSPHPGTTSMRSAMQTNRSPRRGNRYNGVILTGGVHMDSMRAATPSSGSPRSSSRASNRRIPGCISDELSVGRLVHQHRRPTRRPDRRS